MHINSWRIGIGIGMGIRVRKEGGARKTLNRGRLYSGPARPGCRSSLKLPVFYRGSLPRLLALEKYRNLIETNIEAGITLYTDHTPGLK